MYSDAEMEAVRTELETVTAERDALRRVANDNAAARDAYLVGMGEARNDLEVARADLEATRRALGIAEAERDTAMDALGEARKDAAHWRGEAECWQARYEGMEAALRVALEVRK
jgi:chromosome segregation ATPase